MAHLVETICYKPKPRGFDSRWCHWNFYLTQFFRLRTVAQLIETLCYKPKARGFNSRWCRWNYSLPSFRPHSLTNEYQEYFLGGKCGRCVGLRTLPLSRSDCLEIKWPQPPGTLRAYPGLCGVCFTCTSGSLACIFLVTKQ